MDIVTQGIIGALAAQAIANHKNVRQATWVGFVAGLPADADILIRSSTDPLLTLDFHRQFTHALIFIPMGGLIVACLLGLLFKNRIPFRQLFKYSLAGYATSGLLDACTSYGTQLLWPFSNERIAWSVISVVDPLFSITLIVFLFFGWRRSPRYAHMGWLFVFGYLLVGVSQHAQAVSITRGLAEGRGHTMERMVVKPTLGNLLVWRAVYQSDQRYHITAIRVSPFGPPMYFSGKSLPVLPIDTDITQWPKGSTLREDLYRFHHFSDGYLARHPDNPTIIGDIRYALLPFGVKPLWGIVINPERPDLHVAFKTDRSHISEAMELFPKLVTGSWEKWVPIRQSNGQDQPTPFNRFEPFEIMK